MMKPLHLAASFAALAAVGWLLFGDVRHHGFTFDDEDYLDNARRAWSDLGHLVSPEMERPWASRVGVRVYAWLAYPLFGSAPGPYHLVNAAGHLLNALLLLHLVYLRRSSAPLAFLSALLFLANTSHFRAVYWISAVSLVFGVGFVLASLVLVCRYLRGGGRCWLAGGVCSYCAAVLCHQAMGMAAFFPALLAAEEGRPRRRQLRLLIVFLLPGCAILGAERLVYGGAFTGDEAYSLGLHAVRNLAVYTFVLFAGGYTGGAVGLEPPVEAALAAGGLGALVLVLLIRGRTTRLWALWVLCAALPFCFWDRGEALSRYCYFPAAGSAVLLAMGILSVSARLQRAAGKRVARVCLALLLAAGLWVNADTMEKLQAVQYYDSGKYLLFKENPGAAAAPLAEAIRRDPDVPPRVYYWLAVSRYQLREYDEAASVLEELLRRYPGYRPAGKLQRRVLRMLRGQPSQAGGIPSEDRVESLD